MNATTVEKAREKSMIDLSKNTTSSNEIEESKKNAKNKDLEVSSNKFSFFKYEPKIVIMEQNRPEF